MNIIKFIDDNYIYLLIFIFIFSLTNIPIKYYLITSLIILIIYVKYEQKIIDNNNDIKYNLIISDILNDMKKYKKYDKYNFKKGINLINNIFKILNSRNKYRNHHYQYDNLKLYISQCLKYFNSVVLSIPNISLENQIMINEPTNHYKIYTNLCKKLHNQLYKLLYTFGINKNKEITIYSNFINNIPIENDNFYDKYNIY